MAKERKREAKRKKENQKREAKEKENKKRGKKQKEEKQKRGKREKKREPKKRKEKRTKKEHNFSPPFFSLLFPFFYSFVIFLPLVARAGKFNCKIDKHCTFNSGCFKDKCCKDIGKLNMF